jgi:iron complex transport system ATP-binding protein
MLKIDKLNVCINNIDILRNISFELNENDFFTIIGPNGSGKTTIVKSIMNDLDYSGNIQVNNLNIKKINFKEIAKNLGVLTQNYKIDFNATVYDIVSIGRYRHIKDIFGNLEKVDKDKIKEIMKLTNIYDLSNKNITNISGGELQRVFLAQVLVQDPDILILDEPTNHLDIKYQIEIFNILKKWSNQKNKAVIAIVHDLNLVFNYSNKSMLIKEGKIIEIGSPEKVLSKNNLNKAYDIDIYDWMSRLISRWK